MANMIGVPILVSGELKRILGLSSGTEVSHILEVLQRTLGLRIPTRSLTLLERWRNVEKPLRCSEPILERWNSWGEEKAHVIFVLKRRKSEGKRRLRRRSFKTSEFLEEVMSLSVLDEEDYCQIFVNDEETSRFIEAVRLHVRDLELLSQVNSHLQEEEAKIQELMAQVQASTPPSPVEGPSLKDLKTLESELKTQRRSNAGLETLIQVNTDKIDFMKEKLTLKDEEIRGLEYDYNVVEKEGKKLERQYDRIMRLKLCEDAEDEDPSSSGFSSAVSYEYESSLDLEEATETFV